MKSRGSNVWLHWLLVALTPFSLIVSCSDDSGPVDAVKNDSRLDSRTDQKDGGGGTLDQESPQSCELKIESINGKSVENINKLIPSDDQDLTKTGLQIDVVVGGSNLPEGGEVALSVTGLATEPTAKISNGKATFTDITIGSDLKQVIIEAHAANCQQDVLKDIQVVAPPECIFWAPADGVGLSKKDDKNSSTTPFEYDVIVATKNATNGQVVLTVGASTLPGSKSPDSVTGQVTFKDTILPEGDELILKADVTLEGATRSCQAKISVNTGAPKCTFLGFNPGAIATGKGIPGLGMAQDVNTSKSGLQTNIEVETNIDKATLLVDNIPVDTVTVSNGIAKFNAFTLAEGNRILHVTCADTNSGASNQTTPTEVLVDSQPPIKIDDLTCTVTNNRTGDVSCNWTSRGDNAGGSGVEVVQLRYRLDSLLTNDNWDATDTHKLADMVPFPPGVNKSLDIKKLPLGHTYYFGLKAMDYVKNPSDLATPAKSAVVDFIRQEIHFPNGKNWGAIMAAGDFDCDGYTDVAVGDPAADSDKGRVYIYTGRKTGLPDYPYKTIYGTVAGGKFGTRLAALNNFDKDSSQCTDLAVYASNGDTNKGKVYIYLGRKVFFDRYDNQTGTGAELIYQLPDSAAATQTIAGGMASAGDFNHDGATDLALSYVDTATSTDTASVLVIFGDSSLTLMGPGKNPVIKEVPAAAGVQITGGKASESFGLTLANGGLLDEGLYSHLLIGAKDTVIDNNSRGAIYVVKGAMTPTTLPQIIALDNARVIKITGGASNTAFGSAIAFIGDMNNDTWPEFAVSDPFAASNAGAVYLFNLAGAEAPTSVADAVATVVNDVANPDGNQFGIALGCAADIDPKAGTDFNGDQLSDLLAGAASVSTTGVGSVFQINGISPLTGLATSKANFVFRGPTAAPSFAKVVLLAQDINGDGYPDLIVGDPSYTDTQDTTIQGRFFIYY